MPFGGATLLLVLAAGLALPVSAAGLRRGHSQAQARTGSLEMEGLLALRPGAASGRPLLTVGLMHGLGNQLFQVAALLSMAMDQRPAFSVALPAVERVCCNRSTYWRSVLRRLKPFLDVDVRAPTLEDRNHTASPASDRCVLRQVPGFDPWKSNCSLATAFDPAWASGLPAKHRDCPKVTLSGYFQNPVFFSPHLDLVRRIFWDDASAAKAASRLEKLSPNKTRPTLSIHYRLGDYGPNGWVLDQDYYDKALLEVGRRMKAPTCLIFSDEPDRAWKRSALLDGCAERVLVPPSEDDVASFYMMSLTDASVLADSTFAYWAGALGRRKRLVVAPRPSGAGGECWSYLRSGPSGPRAAAAEPPWVAVPATMLSEQQLFAEEIMNMGPPPD